MADRPKKLKAGDRIRVLAGQQMPEFDDVEIGGWTAMILEVRGRGATLKYIVEWSEESVSQFPDHFKEAAEKMQLATEMACLPAEVVERIDDA